MPLTKSIATFVAKQKSVAKKAFARAKRAKRGGKKELKALRKGIRASVKSIRARVKKRVDVDKGYRKRTKEIVRLGRMKVRVGVLQAEGEKPYDALDTSQPLTVFQVGTFHEFGLGVPQRSFIRDWHDENTARLRARFKRSAELVISGERNAKQMGELLGVWSQGEIQARISRGISPVLALSTIRRKGSTVPLVDTGQLRAAVTYEVTF